MPSTKVQPRLVAGKDLAKVKNLVDSIEGAKSLAIALRLAIHGLDAPQEEKAAVEDLAYRVVEILEDVSPAQDH